MANRKFRNAECRPLRSEDTRPLHPADSNRYPEAMLSRGGPLDGDIGSRSSPGHPEHPSPASPNAATQMDPQDPKTPGGFPRSEDTRRISSRRIRRHPAGFNLDSLMRELIHHARAGTQDAPRPRCDPPRLVGFHWIRRHPGSEDTQRAPSGDSLRILLPTHL